MQKWRKMNEKFIRREKNNEMKKIREKNGF
jgi:hypothetical protein